MGDPPVVVLEEAERTGRIRGEPSHTQVFVPAGCISPAINENESDAFDVHVHSLASDYDILGWREGPTCAWGVGTALAQPSHSGLGNHWAPRNGHGVPRNVKALDPPNDCTR